MSFWPEDEENGGSELTMSSQLRKTRSMDSSCLELRLGPSSHPPSIHPNAPSHISSALSRARSEANLHASSLSLGPGDFFARYIILNIVHCDCTATHWDNNTAQKHSRYYHKLHTKVHEHQQTLVMFISIPFSGISQKKKPIRQKYCGHIIFHRFMMDCKICFCCIARAVAKRFCISDAFIPSCTSPPIFNSGLSELILLDFDELTVGSQVLFLFTEKRNNNLNGRAIFVCNGFFHSSGQLNDERTKHCIEYNGYVCRCPRNSTQTKIHGTGIP